MNTKPNKDSKNPSNGKHPPEIKDIPPKGSPKGGMGSFGTTTGGGTTVRNLDP